MSGHDGALPNPRGVKLTYDDFVLFPDDGLRHELIDGEHYVTPSPSLKHQRLALNLVYALEDFLRRERLGRLFFAPVDVVLTPSDVVVPDLLYISNARAQDVATAPNVRVPPDLVIEIGSPGTKRRDTTTKRTLYERTGVSEYWVVDAEVERVRVYRRSGERFARPIRVSAEAAGVLTTPLLPGLEVPISEIFQI